MCLCLVALAELLNTPLVTVSDDLLLEYMVFEGYSEIFHKLRNQSKFKAIVDYDPKDHTYNLAKLIEAADEINGTDSLSDGPDPKLLN